MSDSKPVKHEGTLTWQNGDREPVVVVHGEGQQCEHPGIIDVDKDFHSWEQNGVRHIRRKQDSHTTVGYSRSYSSKYDDVDWGN